MYAQLLGLRPHLANSKLEYDGIHFQELLSNGIVITLACKMYKANSSSNIAYPVYDLHTK